MLALDVAADGSARDRLGRRGAHFRRRCARSSPARSTRTWWCRCRASPTWWRLRRWPRHGLPIVVFGHAGNGNLHVNLMHDDADPAETARAWATLPRVFDLVLALGGTLSGEHGIGTSSATTWPAPSTPPRWRRCALIKTALDPDGILSGQGAAGLSGAVEIPGAEPSQRNGRRRARACRIDPAAWCKGATGPLRVSPWRRKNAGRTAR
jgi:D-lactate dehydrogenase